PGPVLVGPGLIVDRAATSSARHQPETAGGPKMGRTRASTGAKWVKVPGFAPFLGRRSPGCPPIMAIVERYPAVGPIPARPGAAPPRPGRHPAGPAAAPAGLPPIQVVERSPAPSGAAPAP